MPHVITNVAITYFIVADAYSVYAPKEDRALLVEILVFLVPLVILAIVVDKVWK